MKLIATLIFILFSITVFAQETKPTDPALINVRNDILQLIESKKIPSMAIAVSKGDQVLWLEALGYADLETKKPAKITSLYPLGSVSKSITATLIMNLVEQKKLSLMDDVQPLIKPLALTTIDGKQPVIPLWNLLNMTAGLAHGYSSFSSSSLPKTNSQKVNFLDNQAVLAFKPGTVYEYSNHSYSVLEHLIECTTSKSIQQYAPKTLLQVGMSNTLPLYDQGNANLVSTYNERMEKLTPSYAYPGGGQGYYSSAEDLLNYGMFHLGVKKNNTFISERNLTLMQTFRQGPGDLFGLGWFNNNQEVIVSNGNVTGGNARITLDKKEKIVIVCLVNRTSWDGIADNIASKIHEAFVPKDCDKGYETWLRIYEVPYSARFELLGTWQGTMKDPRTGNSINIVVEFTNDGKVTFTIEGRTTDLRSPAYNFFNELTGTLHMTTSFDKAANSYDLKLKYNAGTLTGYLSANTSYADYGVKQPFYIQLRKQ